MPRPKSSKPRHSALPKADAAARASAPPASNGEATRASTESPSDPAATTLFPEPPPRPDVRPEATAFNRDLSWLEFNARVLHQAQDETLPLLERVRFLGIFTSNLDEFVMKRVGWLMRASEARRETDDGLPAERVLSAVRAEFEHLEARQAAVYNRLKPQLASEGVHLLDYSELSADERQWAEAWYRLNVFPVLTPLAVDPGHRFPFISNLSQNLGVLLHEPGSKEQLFARVKVPQGMTQWVRIEPPDAATSGASKRDTGRGRFVQLWEIMQNNLDDLFPGMQITEVMPFRLTRAAEGAAGGLAEDADNLLDFVEAQLKHRRFANVVRLEVARAASPRLVKQIVEMFKIKPEDTDVSQGLLDFRSMFEIAELPRSDLKFSPWTPVVPPRLAEADRESIFDVIRRGDLLVHHPYESFAATTERFIAEAAADAAVLAIKQTIYRTSRDSPFIAQLIKAAESGKQVACLVELQARFDESRNVRLAQALEKAGVHVAYGVVGLKTHCKAALVVRKEADGLRSYAHIGTGNYNPSTAKLYTDLGLLTCDPRLTEDVADLFNLLTGRSRKSEYHRLLVAPATMKKSFLQLIRRETELAEARKRGENKIGGRITAKMNALEDPAVIRELYKASQAGVKVSLFVRGFCTLRPGIEGLSENITVTSVVGRFLEHSRIFHFGAGAADPLDGEWYIGSGDWMSRNLDGRVEAAAPVTDRSSRGKLQRMLSVMSLDCRSAWDLRPDGRYSLRDCGGLGEEVGEETPERLGTFNTMMRDALGVT